MFPVFFLSKKPDRPTYLHTSRVDDDPVPVTKSKIHSHWEKKGNQETYFSSAFIWYRQDIQMYRFLKQNNVLIQDLKKMEMMMKELAEKLIPINSNSHYCKRRHIGSHTRECLHKPMQNKLCLQNPLILQTNNFGILTVDD